jgi:predicted double-glycine peptidase
MNLFRSKAAAAVLATLAALALPAAAAAQVRFGEDPGPATVKVMSWRDIPFRTVVRQQYDYSCGSAALATLLTYSYGLKTSESDAFTAMYAKGDQEKIRKVGFSMLDMKHYAETLGLHAQGYRLSLAEIARARTPVIALIDIGAYRHFVVVKGVAENKVLIGDPALGLKVIPAADFARMWNGVALQVDGPVAQPPAFNADKEWSPWARAPVRWAADNTSSLTTVTSNQFILYQITPVLDINFRPGA